jgi:uncharacterized tellurite resistance protein B-like protein
MRYYPSNSPEAMARIIALALMADGAIDLSEIKSLQRHEISKNLDLDDRQFDKVVHDFCEDMMTFAHHAPSGQFELDQKSIDALLGEIQDPDLQNQLLSAMLHIVNAEGKLLSGEAVLVSRAMTRWGLDLRATSDSWEPQRALHKTAGIVKRAQQTVSLS